MSHHLHAAALAQADTDRLIEMAAQSSERMCSSPTVDNRLLHVEASLALLMAQHRALTTAACAQQEFAGQLEEQLPLEAYLSLDGSKISRIVSSGAAFIHESDLEIRLNPNNSIRIALHPRAECVLAAREYPVVIETVKERERQVRAVFIAQIQRAGAFLVTDHFECYTAGQGCESYTLEFSIASLGGLITSPLRVCWSLSRAEGSRDE